MKTPKMFGIRNRRIFYTVVAVISLCAVFLSIITYIYSDAESDGYDDLHIDTKEIKENINLQIHSDVENLETIARFAAELYEHGENYNLLFESFHSIGLIKRIGVLTPDNNFTTTGGSYNVGDMLDFSTEIQKGEYISGRVPSIIDPRKTSVRVAVPVLVGNETVAMIYGVIESELLYERYAGMAVEREADLFIIERSTGDLIVDTVHDVADNVNTFRTSNFKKGFSHEKLIDDLISGKNGYSAFLSGTTGEFFYAHYAPLAVSDWEIMLSKPERIVFAEARDSFKRLITLFVGVVIIMTLYLGVLFSIERKQSKLNLFASNIRKKLLTVNETENGIAETLGTIASYGKAGMAFFFHSNGEQCVYAVPGKNEAQVSKADMEVFVSELLMRSEKALSYNNETFLVKYILPGDKFADKSPKLNDMLLANGIKNVCLAAVVDEYKNINVLGVSDSKAVMAVIELLKEITVCFSMAVYNKNHLNETETTATTDSLTGLYNRMKYKQDCEMFDSKKPVNFSCVYIDVNELHSFNNKFGHTAGDRMLLFVGDCLKEFFTQGNKYRMGGDEFLVFNESIGPDEIDASVEKLIKKVEDEGYHISVGVDFTNKSYSTEDVVKTAEKRMYEAKAEYYQQKNNVIVDTKQNEMMFIKSGNKEVDAAFRAVCKHYYGIFSVSLDRDEAVCLMMPEYLKVCFGDEKNFKLHMQHYINEFVHPDDQRALGSFLEYDVLKRQLQSGNIPCINYYNVMSESVSLSVYSVSGKDSGETLWVFERTQ